MGNRRSEGQSSQGDSNSLRKNSCRPKDKTSHSTEKQIDGPKHILQQLKSGSYFRSKNCYNRNPYRVENTDQIDTSPNMLNYSPILHKTNHSRQQINVRQHKSIDTSLLSRGMTTRVIGIRVSNQMKTLSSTEIERDLRHMEAHSAACISYAQQLFAFSNRELVTRGHYGPSPPAPSMTFCGERTSDGRPNGHGSGVTMPVKIDPEEEKRISILRQRVAASEAKREVLETEYLSLRAHYVHESHKIRRIKCAINGQVQFLKDLLIRRGKVLALRRVRVGVARDVLACLAFRSNQGVVKSPGGHDTFRTDCTSIAGTELIPLPSHVDHMCNAKSKLASSDMCDVWSLLDTQLQEAELACTKVTTPNELLYIKNALQTDATALESANDSSNSVSSNISHISHMGSPVRVPKDDEGHVMTETSSNDISKKKSRHDRVFKKNSNHFNTFSKSNNGNAAFKIENDKDYNTIPWSGRVMPRTPHGLVLYLSNLSHSPEHAAAFGCEKVFGSSPQSLTWLEPNLPSPNQYQTISTRDSERLKDLKRKVYRLKEELRGEVNINSKLQRDITEGRKRSDEICAMMTMVRSETEAVVHRHNQILETSFALNQTKILLEKGTTDRNFPEDVENKHSSSVEIRRREANEDSFHNLTKCCITELDVGGEGDDGTVMAEDEEENDGFGIQEDLNKYSGNYDASDENESDEHQPILEVIVPSGSQIPEESSLSHSPISHKRGYRSTSVSLYGSEKKRRKI